MSKQIRTGRTFLTSLEHSEGDGFTNLLADWKASGGTVEELLISLKTPAGVELASTYGITPEETAKQVEAFETVDKFLERASQPGHRHDRIIAKLSEMGQTREQILQIYREERRGAYKEALQAVRESKGSPSVSKGEAAKQPNTERYPDMLDLWQQHGGTPEEFNQLTLEQLLFMGVTQAKAAEDLARAAWESSGGTPEEWEELASGQRAELIEAYSK